MATVVDLLQQRAKSRPDDRAFLFVDEENAWVTVAQVDRAARAIAAHLCAQGAAGQPVLLLYPPGRSYVEGFLGCLYAGAVAVPAYPPDPNRLARTLPRLRTLLADCGARSALSLSWLAETAQSLDDLATLTWITTDTVADETDWQPPVLSPTSLALLQYTSGSTGAPKGVMLTHANLMHNSRLIREGFGATPDDIGVSWLPPYHDMGLIGGILQPLHTGLPVALMSPLSFLARPLSWLETISSLGATISGGPNFAFDLCVRKSTPEQRAELDLSRWSLAFCGAEPIRAATLERFADAFADSGFRPEAFYPCYGLAEATLIVTGGRRGAGVTKVGEHLSSGAVLGDQRLSIVDPASGEPCAVGVEGEIRISGASVTSGFWNRPDERVEALPAGQLRTGDLGFVNERGELVVTGRLKDLIIVRGRNLHPQDLEEAVERAVPGIRAGCCAAFGYERDGHEHVAFACEVTGEHSVAASAIRQVLTETFEISLSAIILLEPGQIPKTSSGKIQRHACKRSFLDGSFPTAWREADPGDIVARVLRASAVDDDTPLTRLGIDSMQAFELSHRLHAELGIDVTPAEILSGVTLAEVGSRPRSLIASRPLSTADEPTDGQRALWFVQQWAPGTTVYHVSRAVRIHSSIDVDALDAALKELVHRHPALRTCLPARDGEPVRRLISWPGLARHDTIDIQAIQADADRPFDLENGPLFRASLYTHASDEHVLLLSLHHTITDFWSWSVMVEELLALYHGKSLPPAGPPPVATPVDPNRLDYWRHELDGAPPATDLPTTFPRPRLQSLRGSTYDFRFDAAPVTRFAGALGVTPFSVLLAGWLATLARYAGDDVVTGITAAGRDDPRTRDSVGYFATPLPIRARLSPELTFRQLVDRVKAVVLGAIEHAVPLARLAQHLRPERDPSRPVLIQSMFVLQSPPGGRADLTAFLVQSEEARVNLGGLELSPLRITESAAAFDLSIVVTVRPDGWHGSVSYCSDLFDEASVAGIVEHFTTLTVRAVASPDAAVRSVDLMDAREREVVLGFAAGEPMPEQAETLPRVLAHQVKRRPDALALSFGAQALSYLELDRASDRLAARLQRRGVERGSVVGVRLPRGPDAVIAFWAVQKAGGIYLPLEPNLPAARLEWMLQDAKPVNVITSIEGENGFEPVAIEPDDTAYLIYTSGSTGRPKGVLVAHRGAANLGSALSTLVGLSDADRMLQYASCAFDAWIAEVLMAHATGACLVITPAEAVMPGPRLVALLAEQRVTAAIFSPSTLAALPDAELADLRLLMCAGEACPPELVTRWGNGRRFYNLYGPTEATVCATGGPSTADGRRPSIGRPIPNTCVYVLDESGGLAPIGVPGELFIGGIGVAQGYLNQPELTEKHFRPHPFGPGRLYRSGDRVRWLPDGTLDFLGRVDDQVKIRGVRVEPGEVASRLRQLLGLREVAVVPAGTQLVAYLVAGEPRPSVSELRELLRGEFAAPWIPSAFVYLDTLPLNSSGKLDKAALPAPTPADRGASDHIPPRTELEAAVADVFGEVLQQDPIGVRDHFFDQLGGNSLLVARVTSALGTRLGRQVPVTHLFEHPTVETLARRLSSESGAGEPEVGAGQRTAQARRQALARRRGEN